MMKSEVLGGLPALAAGPETKEPFSFDDWPTAYQSEILRQNVMIKQWQCKMGDKFHHLTLRRSPDWRYASLPLVWYVAYGRGACNVGVVFLKRPPSLDATPRTFGMLYNEGQPRSDRRIRFPYGNFKVV